MLRQKNKGKKGKSMVKDLFKELTTHMLAEAAVAAQVRTTESCACLYSSVLTALSLHS